MKKFLVLMIVVAVIGGTAGLVSCGSSGGDSSEFAGTWLATGEDGGVGKAVILELGSDSLTRIAFTEYEDEEDPGQYDMIQEEGQKGQYSTSGDNFAISIVMEWDDNTTAWVPETDTAVVPYSYSGTTLTLEVEPGLYVPFTRIEFTRHANLAGTTWGGVLSLNSNGTYAYDESGYTSSGTWSATDGLVRIITTNENGSGIYIENLYEYEIQGTELVLSWNGRDMWTY